ncbi:MAG: hypothetical protein IH868_12020 [Chloroflexi bacterium]|nr:hypothetical protein [Chloroflexota bacterium]
MADVTTKPDNSKQLTGFQAPGFQEGLRAYWRYVGRAARAEWKKVGFLIPLVLGAAIRQNLPGPPEIWLSVLALALIAVLIYVPISAFRLYYGRSEIRLAENEKQITDLKSDLRAEKKNLIELSAKLKERSRTIEQLESPHYPGIAATLSGNDQVSLKITNTGDGTGEFLVMASISAPGGGFSGSYPLIWDDSGGRDTVNIAPGNSGFLLVARIGSEDRRKLLRKHYYRWLDMLGGRGAPSRVNETEFDERGNAHGYVPTQLKISVSSEAVPADPNNRKHQDFLYVLSVEGRVPSVSVRDISP